MHYFRLHQTVACRLGRSGAMVMLLLAGCALAMPGVARAAGCESSYTVQAGETLTQIARDNGLSVDALAQANEIADANTIYANQSLCLPAVSADGSVRIAGDGFGRLNGGANGSGPSANAGGAANGGQNLSAAQWVSEESNGPGEGSPMVAGFGQPARNSSGPGADGPMATGFGQPSGDDGGQVLGSVQWVTEESANQPVVADGFGLLRNNAGSPMATGFGQPSGNNGGGPMVTGFGQPSSNNGGQATGFPTQP